MEGSVRGSVASQSSYSVQREESEQFTEADKIIWAEICSDYENNIAKIEEYLKSKSCESEVDPNPAIGFLTNSSLLPILKSGLYEMLLKVKEDDSFYVLKTAFDGVDYLSEYLYNMNPKYPERKANWTYIFDMKWVEELLAEK
nr:unnamed protein product [Callosobruchus analis]